MLRGNISPAAIASLHHGVINHIELDDVPLLPVADYATDTISRRCAPGEGEMPVQDFLSAVAATGYQGLYGVEILSDAFRQMAVEEAATSAFDGARRVLERTA